MKTVTLVQIKASEVKLGDRIARASGCIMALEFIAVHELRTSIDGRVILLQKSKNGTTLDGDALVWKVAE